MSTPLELLPPSTAQLLKSYTDITMETSTIKSYKQDDPKEEFIVDLDSAIKENEFSLGTLSQIKQTILDNPNIISDSFCSSLSQFVIEPTFLYPELIH